MGTQKANEKISEKLTHLLNSFEKLTEGTEVFDIAILVALAEASLDLMDPDLLKQARVFTASAMKGYRARLH